MKEQILKGWVCPFGDEDEIYLLKAIPKDFNSWKYSKRSLINLISNALEALGNMNSGTDEDFEKGINKKYVVENIEMQLYVSDKVESLESIKNKLIIDSMGLLDYKEGWYGWSSWTITGYDVETFTLGGHDIHEIIQPNIGKYVYLIINQENSNNK